MSGLRMLWVRLLRRGEASRIDEEIEYHVAMLTAEFERQGMSPGEAQLAARREFGGVALAGERWREQRSLPFVETVWQDLRYAVRQLRANPGFTATAVLTLALGIGANTAIFRVLNAVLLQSLPVRDPGSLVIVTGHHDDHLMSFSFPLFEEMSKRQNVAEGMLAATDFPMPDSPIRGRLATGGYFRILGVNAQLGRVFTEEDDRESGPAVAVISDGYWRRTFGGRADVLGRVLALNKGAVTIIGVAPPGFFGERVGGAPDVWVPMRFAPQVWSSAALSPSMAMLTPIARLRRDVPAAQAQAALNVLYGQLKDRSPRRFGESRFYLELKPGSRGLLELQDIFSEPLRVLMAIAGLVLLLACANLANLLLARAAARSHEIAVRLAVGAGRSRLVRQLLTESLVVAGLGGVCGAAVAMAGSRALIALASVGHSWRITLDSGWRVPLFLGSITVATAVLFGIAPAVMAVRMSGRTHSAGRSRQRAARLFVVAQVSISLVLVAGAALLVRSFWNLERQDFGYRREGVLMVSMRIDMGSFKAAREVQVDPVYRRLQAMPGARSVALGAMGPFSALNSNTTIVLADKPPSAGDSARLVSVSARYFETMGIPIVRGRGITEDDRTETPNVAVISETAARRTFGSEDPIGRFFTSGTAFDAKNVVEIVGVAHDIRLSSPRDPFEPVVYLPLAQHKAPLTSVVIRTPGDPTRFAGAAREAVREALPALPIAEIRTVEDLVSDDLAQERMMALLSGAFGGLALVLAAVGLYGLIAYGVERRTQEIGIRLALGARRAQVTAMLLRQTVIVLLVGAILGGTATLALGRWVRSLLYGVTAHDPVMLSVAAGVLGVVALVASYLPASRAARIDPVNALRQ